MVNEIKYLPHSGRRITLDKNGNVYLNGKILQCLSVANELCVNFSWIFGQKNYPVSMLMVLTFLPFYLPDFLWDRIEPLYKDGNTKNVVLDNLTYRFRNGPLEVEEHPGFFYVPFYTNYCINRSGSLLNAESGKLMTWYTVKPSIKRNSTGGYKACRAVFNTGTTKILFRHRALALAFLKYDYNIENLVVNHKDGQPANDELDNLEWMTHSQNNLHAYKSGLRPNSAAPLLVKNTFTGVITEFVNIQEAARSLNLPGYKIQYRLRHCRNKIFDDGLLFRHKRDFSDFPESDLLVKEKDRRAKDIVCRNIDTGETYLFDSKKSCGLFFNISPTTVAKYIDSRKPLSGIVFSLA